MRERKAKKRGIEKSERVRYEMNETGMNEAMKERESVIEWQ